MGWSRGPDEPANITIPSWCDVQGKLEPKALGALLNPFSKTLWANFFLLFVVVDQI